MKRLLILCAASLCAQTQPNIKQFRTYAQIESQKVTSIKKTQLKIDRGSGDYQMEIEWFLNVDLRGRLKYWLRPRENGAESR